jgi:soluble lytic murein transglycosylase-like protein
MKKICLSFVLSIVSVFSISAQTTAQMSNNLTAQTGVVENIKVESDRPKTETEPVKTTDQTSEAEKIAEEKKPQATEEQPKPAVSQPVKNLEVRETLKTPALAEVPQPRVSESANNPGLSVLAARKVSLDGLSTGNPAVDGYIEEFSALYNVDPLLIYAQMSQESSFNGRATSSKGASGFMQLMPDTARRFGVTNIYNPQQNIKAGVKYMRWLLDKFGGDPRLALAGYNAGEGSVMKYGNKVPPYRETQNYVTKIMKHYDLIANQDSTLAVVVQPANK